MNETTTIAHGAEQIEAPFGKASFSYCCECGTYDAHVTMCTCCGYDFSGDPASNESE